MRNIDTDNGSRVTRLTFLILCTVFFFGMMLEFIISEYHTILHPFVMLDIFMTIPLMYLCIKRIKQLYATILLENQNLLMQDEKFLSAFDVINSGIAILSSDGTLLNINKKMCRLLGFSQNNTALQEIQKTLQMDELRNNKKFIESLLEKKLGKYQTIMQAKNRNGDQVWMTANISLITNTAGILQYFIIQTQKLFTRTRTASGKTIINAQDSLSGIMGMDNLEKHVTKAMAMADMEVSKIVFIYLAANISDDISRLLDQDGTLTFMQIFAKRIRNAIRDTDYVGAESSGRFLICLTNVNEFNPEKIIQKINNNLTSPLIIKGSEIVIAVNYGICTFPHDGNSFAILAKHAKLAYKQTKLRDAKKNYFVFNPECLEEATYGS